MNIHEVLEYGPIVAHDEELGLLVTANGAYFNLWVGDGDEFTNAEAFDLASRVKHTDSMSVLHEAPFVTVWEAGQALLAEIIAEGEEE